MLEEGKDEDKRAKTPFGTGMSNVFALWTPVEMTSR